MTLNESLKDMAYVSPDEDFQQKCGDPAKIVGLSDMEDGEDHREMGNQAPRQGETGIGTTSMAVKMDALGGDDSATHRSSETIESIKCQRDQLEVADETQSPLKQCAQSVPGTNISLTSSTDKTRSTATSVSLGINEMPDPRAPSKVDDLQCSQNSKTAAVVEEIGAPDHQEPLQGENDLATTAREKIISVAPSLAQQAINAIKSLQETMTVSESLPALRRVDDPHEKEEDANGVAIGVGFEQAKALEPIDPLLVQQRIHNLKECLCKMNELIEANVNRPAIAAHQFRPNIFPQGNMQAKPVASVVPNFIPSLQAMPLPLPISSARSPLKTQSKSLTKPQSKPAQPKAPQLFIPSRSTSSSSTFDPSPLQAGDTLWSKVIRLFEEKYHEVYLTTDVKKKAHIDCCDEIGCSLIHEPKMKWFPVLFLDALVHRAYDKKFSLLELSSVERRHFNQHLELKRAILLVYGDPVEVSASIGMENTVQNEKESGEHIDKMDVEELGKSSKEGFASEDEVGPKAKNGCDEEKVSSNAQEVSRKRSAPEDWNEAPQKAEDTSGGLNILLQAFEIFEDRNVKNSAPILPNTKPFTSTKSGTAFPAPRVQSSAAAASPANVKDIVQKIIFPTVGDPAELDHWSTADRLDAFLSATSGRNKSCKRHKAAIQLLVSMIAEAPRSEPFTSAGSGSGSGSGPMTFPEVLNMVIAKIYASCMENPPVDKSQKSSTVSKASIVTTSSAASSARSSPHSFDTSSSISVEQSAHAPNVVSYGSAYMPRTVLVRPPPPGAVLTHAAPQIAFEAPSVRPIAAPHVTSLPISVSMSLPEAVRAPHQLPQHHHQPHHPYLPPPMHGQMHGAPRIFSNAILPGTVIPTAVLPNMTIANHARPKTFHFNPHVVSMMLSYRPLEIPFKTGTDATLRVAPHSAVAPIPLPHPHSGGCGVKKARR